MLATFMEVLDTSIAAVALPYIAGSLSATTDEATWVLTSYLVANAIVLPASTWFSLQFRPQAISHRSASPFSPFFVCLRGGYYPRPVLDCARDSGRGRWSPPAALTGDPPRNLSARQTRPAMAVFALGVVVAPVLGPTLGGWLTDTYSWR